MAQRGTNYQLRQFAEATLGSGSLRKAARLPEGEDENEWLAVNGGLLKGVLGWPEPGLDWLVWVDKYFMDCC